MNEADQAIAALLGRLREAEPSAGLERRILTALAMREQQISESPRHLLHVSRSWQLAGAVSLAGLILLATCLVFLPEKSSKIAPKAQRSSGVKDRPAQRNPWLPESGSAAKQVVLRASRKPHHAQESSAEENVGRTSFPAPPLPLTEQEKLLLRLARRNDPKDRTLLNPELRAAQAAKSTQQFQQFFAIDATEMRSQLE
jgi:hypothetical protein